MIPSFIITFRETLEAALIGGIILGYLVRTKQTKYNNIVYLGVFSGILTSALSALLFTVIAGGFTGRAEEIFEGITMLLGASLLTTMILWMRRQKHMVKKLEGKAAIELTKVHKLGLFLLIFCSYPERRGRNGYFFRGSQFYLRKQYFDWSFGGNPNCHLSGVRNICGLDKNQFKKIL